MERNQFRLTKEGFWDSLAELFPKSTNVFYEWLDQYKKEVGFDPIFLNDRLYRQIGELAPIEFHDLPDAMQFGIFMLFICETDNTFLLKICNPIYFLYYTDTIKSFFEEAEKNPPQEPE